MCPSMRKFGVKARILPPWKEFFGLYEKRPATSGNGADILRKVGILQYFCR
jgi:hypothetical protein